MKRPKCEMVGFVLMSCLFFFVFFSVGGVQTAESQTRVKVAQGAEPTRLDPDMHRENVSTNAILHIYDALLERNREGDIRLDLAESWRFLSDTILEFKLRKGIKFSNGEPFNAQVVKYNIERVAGLLPGAKKTLTTPGWEGVKEVKVIEDYKVKIITKN